MLTTGDTDRLVVHVHGEKKKKMGRIVTRAGTAREYSGNRLEIRLRGRLKTDDSIIVSTTATLPGQVLRETILGRVPALSE